MTTNHIATLSPSQWKDYELIDTGHFEKLERFGPYILRRPEPQAIWDSSLSEEEWNKMAHAYFKKDKGSPEKGVWLKLKTIPDLWYIKYPFLGGNIHFKISLSSFKHVGIFPEQAANWDYIAAHAQPGEKLLNLFAYTGGASLAAKAKGAEVTHVDSIKQVISWARDNMTASGLDNIRWMAEDALKFVLRENRRENIYHGLILDPPAYGRGPEGEKWILEEHLNQMLKSCATLLNPEKNLFILNLYSLGFSALIVENLMKAIFPWAKNVELGELYLTDSFNKKLPLGVYCRFYQ
jgi:23S rRNA (cytosine1962-C5)-methyltransferase